MFAVNANVCIVYSKPHNDVSQVAQRYGTIAAHTRRRASPLVVFVVFSVHMYIFAGLIRRTPPPTFSDTAVTDRHSDTTFFQLRAHWVRISWSVGSDRRASYPLGQALRLSVNAKIYGVRYKQSSFIAFDETSSSWSAPKSS